MFKLVRKFKFYRFLTRQYKSQLMAYKITGYQLQNVMSILIDEMSKDLLAGKTIRVKNFFNLHLKQLKPKQFYYKFFNEWRYKKRGKELKIFINNRLKQKIRKFIIF